MIIKPNVEQKIRELSGIFAANVTFMISGGQAGPEQQAAIQEKSIRGRELEEELSRELGLVRGTGFSRKS